jgi:CBS domain-containing protein
MNELAATTTPSVGDLMTADPIVIDGDAPLIEAARLFDLHRIHGLPVVAGDGSLIGVISQTDMIRARTTEQLWAGWRGLKVRHLMTSPALTIAADAGVDEAAASMEANAVHRLVVLAADGRSPAGILCSSDIVHGMLSEGGPQVGEVGR